MAQDSNVIRRGIYNVEYFSGAQVSLYIGDVFVDEVTTLSYGVQQSRRPIYGYASTLFDDVSEGHVMVSGTFTINFKEAGYLWLILDRYRDKIKGKSTLARTPNAFFNSGAAERQNIENIINGETSVFAKNQFLQELAELSVKGGGSFSPNVQDAVRSLNESRTSTRASLGGFASTTRSTAAVDANRRNNVGRAENEFEKFEDAVWGLSPQKLDLEDRRADDSRLNPFEMYVAFGDFAGDNTANHTIERIRDVYILGKSKVVQIDGMPIQEQYSFIARNLI